MRRRPTTLLVALVAVGALTAGCGLKQQQLDALKQQQNGFGNNQNNGSTGGVDQTTGGTTGAIGTTGGTTGALGTTGGTTGALGTTGGTTGVGTSGGTSGGSSGATSGGTTGGGLVKCSTMGQNVVGITPTEIRVGVHAPLTGTGTPLPANSFKDGLQAYWKSPAHKVCGRTVVIDFQDDKYTPQTARDVCGPMSRRDFIVIGAAGTDQIQSCATMPDIAGKGVPYLSAGVTTNGLTSLKHYFALTLTYAQQADLVLRNARAQHYGLKRWAVVTSNTDNFKDARDAIESVLKAAKVPYDDIQVNATSDSNEQARAQQTGSTLASGCPVACKYDTVFVDTSPGYWIFTVGFANGQGFNGQYVGPGVTMTEVTVAELACSGTGNQLKANFLAPYPGIDRATAEFKTANNNSYDDIYWSLWGLSQAIQQALDNAASLTRPAFINSLANGSLPGGVYPPEHFNGGHFGGTGAYSLKLNCTEKEPNQNQLGAWDTLAGPLKK
jgi:branched-chain amino acid transport system substrate-binding protein